MIEYFFILIAIGAIGYCAYWLGHFAGYQKCQDVYEKVASNFRSRFIDL